VLKTNSTAAGIAKGFGNIGKRSFHRRLETQEAALMSIFAWIGSIFLLVSISLLVYQVMMAFMGMGVSDEFTFENITLTDLLDVSTVESIESIPSIYLHSIAETLLTLPLAILLLGVAVFFFLIHTFTGKRRIRKR
jgi:hypothetical protein